MADTLTFTPGGTGGTPLTVTPVKGSVKYGGGHDDRGGGVIPPVRAGWAYNGSCQVIVDGSTGPTIAALKTLMAQCAVDASGAASPIGEGKTGIAGAGIYANVRSSDALVDVSIEGDSVQTATITWKGTGAPAA